MAEELDEDSRTLIAALVRERRLALGGMTQKQAADRADLSDTTWNQVETGKPVSYRSMGKILRSLGWATGSPKRVLSGEDRSLELEQAPMPLGAEDELLAAVRELTAVVRELRADLAEGRRAGPRPPS